MRRKLQITGYTRVSGGKAVKVKPHSRMSGKDGVNESSGRSQPGDEFRSKQSEHSVPQLTKEEWDEVLYQNELARMPAWRRRQLEEMVEASEEKTTKSQHPLEYRSQTGISGALNRLADNLDAWAEKHSRKKR